MAIKAPKGKANHLCSFKQNFFISLLVYRVTYFIYMRFCFVLCMRVARLGGVLGLFHTDLLITRYSFPTLSLLLAHKKWFHDAL